MYFPVEKHRFCSVSKRWGLPTSTHKAKMVCALEEFRDLASLLLCFVTFNGLLNHLLGISKQRKELEGASRPELGLNGSGY